MGEYQLDFLGVRYGELEKRLEVELGFFIVGVWQYHLRAAESLLGIKSRLYSSLRVSGGEFKLA